MSPLLLVVALSALPTADPRGFQFTVPGGFEPFPDFQPTATKLYAFGKNLGTPDAVTLTLDVLDGPVVAGSASRSCGALLNAIDRTVGKPITEHWKNTELSGLRMVMTHPFGEVLVFCVDVPIAPNGISLMVSGKPANEAALKQAFEDTLSSLENKSPAKPFWWGAAVALIIVIAVVRRRRKNRGN